MHEQKLLYMIILYQFSGQVYHRIASNSIFHGYFHYCYRYSGLL